MTCGCQGVFNDRPRKGTQRSFFDIPLQEDHGRFPSLANYDESAYDLIMNVSSNSLFNLDSDLEVSYEVESLDQSYLINDTSYVYGRIVPSSVEVHTSEQSKPSMSYTIYPSVEVIQMVEVSYSLSRIIDSLSLIELDEEISFVYDNIIYSENEIGLNVNTLYSYSILVDVESEVDILNESYLRNLSFGEAQYTLRNDLDSIIFTVKPFKFDKVVYNRIGSIIQLSPFKVIIVDKEIEMDLLNPVMHRVESGELTFRNLEGFIVGVNITDIEKSFVQDGNADIIVISNNEPKDGFTIQFIGM